MISSIFWILSLITVIGIIISKDLLINILLFGLFGTFSSGAYLFMGAPDVSFASFALGAAFTTFVFLISIRKTGKLTVAYLEAPYMITENENGEIWGFEFDVLKEYANSSNMDLDFIKLESLDDLKHHSTHIDILAGGLFEEMITEEIRKDFTSVKEIPTRIALDKNGDLRDLMRIKSLIVSGEQTLDFLTESKTSEYILLISKHDKDMYSKINSFIKKLKDEGKIEEYISRNLG